MSDPIKHECAVALLRLLEVPAAAGTAGGSGGVAPRPFSDPGGTALSLLLEKQHNRGQDGAGAAVLSLDPEPGSPAWWLSKSASSTALADLLAAIGRRPRPRREAVFLGHLRYATYGRGDESFCHPFVHAEPRLDRTLFLAGNFNLTNTHELFDAFQKAGNHAASSADGYLICELLAAELAGGRGIAAALRETLPKLDGAFALCGMTGDGWSFAVRDARGIRPGWFHVSPHAAAVASERPAIQAAFDVPPEAVRELPPGEALLVSPAGEVRFERVLSPALPRPCAFERIYFSRANDADIHRERKALGAALVPQILEAAQAPLEDIFFSYIPNSARIAFHGLLEELFRERGNLTQRPQSPQSKVGKATSRTSRTSREVFSPRFGEIAVKDAKFRTFIADAAARREIGRHVYDVTYGLVRPGTDTLVVLDDSIVRGTTMRDAILPMLDRLGPKRIVVASSAPPIRYPDCYGIDMSTLGELVAFKALVNLLGKNAEADLGSALQSTEPNPLAPLYDRFSEKEHAAEIARLLTPPGMRAEVSVVYQTVPALHAACPGSTGDWYFTGDYPTPGGYRVLRTAIANHLGHKGERSY